MACAQVVFQEYEYDEAGGRSRKVRITDAASTVYVAGLYERRADVSGEQHVFYVRGEPGVVAQVTYAGAATATRFVVADGIGSATLFLDETGAAIERTRYDPFGGRVDQQGEAQSSDPDPSTTLGYTAHEEDGGGLVDMRGRIYDRGQYARQPSGAAASG